MTWASLPCRAFIIFEVGKVRFDGLAASVMIPSLPGVDDAFAPQGNVGQSAKMRCAVVLSVSLGAMRFVCRQHRTTLYHGPPSCRLKMLLFHIAAIAFS